MKVLPLLSTLAILTIAQDTKTLVISSDGNGSSLNIGSKIESTLQPDITLGGVPTTLVPPQPMMLPSDYFFSAPQHTFLHHRSESAPPYGYEYANNIAYPVAQPMEHSVAPTKHLLIVSFIGLLLLLAIIQNTLSAVKRKDALMDLLSSRQKRDLYVTHDFHSMTPEEEEILNEDARVRCIQRTICLENYRLFKDLGTLGKMMAKYLTKDIEKSLKPSSGWDRLVKDSGAAGIRGDNCNVLYRDCDTPVTTKIYKVSNSISTSAKTSS